MWYIRNSLHNGDYAMWYDCNMCGESATQHELRPLCPATCRGIEIGGGPHLETEVKLFTLIPTRGEGILDINY